MVTQSPRREVDLCVLNQMLAPACPGHTAVCAELLSGGFANKSFKVTLSGRAEPVVVRVYVRDPTAAAREASILELVKASLPVPEVIYVSPGAHQPNTYVVLRWVDGIPLDDALTIGTSADARRTVRAAGRVLATLQAFRFPTPGFFGTTMRVQTPLPHRAPAIVGVLEHSLFQEGGAERLGDPLTRRLWRFMTEHQGSLARIEHHSTLVHGDLNGLNVIVSVAPHPPRVAALIDWEYAHAGTPLLDLASLFRRPGRRLPPWYEEELMRGYQGAGGTLPDNWKQLLHMVDLVRLCAFVRSPDAGGVAVDGARALIEAALADERQ